MLEFVGGLIAFGLAVLLFRDADPRNPDVWDGVELGLTVELLSADDAGIAEPLAALWSLDVERRRYFADAGTEPHA